MMIIKTENSTYEIDRSKKQLRRVVGKEKATYYTGKDSEWQSYRDLSEPEVGHRLLIVWDFIDDVGGKKVAKSTYTSPIISIGRSSIDN